MWDSVFMDFPLKLKELVSQLPTNELCCNFLVILPFPSENLDIYYLFFSSEGGGWRVQVFWFGVCSVCEGSAMQCSVKTFGVGAGSLSDPSGCA